MQELFDTPILFIIFKRPETTQQVFKAIRKVKPTRLFVAANAPSANIKSEAELCQETRDILMQVDWDCEVQTLFREQHLDCKVSLSSAIDWFFDNVEKGIILEDDCLPHPTFFRFCEELLEKYRTDERVMMISGDNFQFGRKGDEASYYFSRYTHIWGWASWRRAWRFYDVDLKLWDNPENRKHILRNFSTQAERKIWKLILDKVKDGNIDTWDYQWSFACLTQNALVIIPTVNLISNIGFGLGSTHTTGVSIVANMPTAAMEFPLVHPRLFIRDIDADENVGKLFFRMPSLIRRASGRIKRFFCN